MNQQEVNAKAAEIYGTCYSVPSTMDQLKDLIPRPTAPQVAEAMHELGFSTTWQGMAGIYDVIVGKEHYEWNDPT